jgi:hypothetical protein
MAMNTAPNGTWGELITYYAASAPGDELPEELACRQSRLKRIQKAKKALEDKAKVFLTVFIVI